MSKIDIITTPFMFNIITTPFMFNIPVNCYLVSDSSGFILIDTAMRRQRASVEKALERAGCTPGKLRLILLTHGDFDHCANAAYFRKKYGAKIAMHCDDVGMPRDGNMFYNRKAPNPIMKAIFGLIVALPKADRFEPDISLKDGDDLTSYGLNARVVELPGHSRGNIGVLTPEGDLFCGDLLGNLKKPELWSLIDDQSAAAASLEKLKRLPITTVYPGHGKPFPFEALWEQARITA